MKTSRQAPAPRGPAPWPGVLPLVLAALLLVLPAGAAPASGSPVHEYMLDNGLKLLVREDHRAPVVVSQIWYKVGGSNEHSGITGISHVLEHMMFKGTAKIPPGKFSKIIAANGGQDNAFTGKDYTAYFQQLERSRLAVSFELEADRMLNLTLPEDEFMKERQVVIEERRLRTEDRPRALTYEQFNAVAFLNSPYKNPIIGWRDDLDSLTVADLRDWYQRWYTPNNATLVVVGDVVPDEVHALAQQHFGSLPKRPVPPIKSRRETPQQGMRRITVRAHAQLPYLLMGYKVPVLKTAAEEWEAYALEVLAGVLAGGESARFPRRIVREQQLAAGVDVGYNLWGRYSDLFLVDATPSEGRTAADVEAAIRAEITRLQDELVSEEELRRVKAQVIAQSVYERDSVFYQAMQLGQLETVDLGWQRADEYVDRVRAVTREQLQQVAKKYLVDDGLTVAVLEPLPVAGAQAGGE